ncbi:MAG: hypothetical protein LBO69_06380 [Ignavibacteria bacterium]|jgi:hypothetical protein|nr:hypothetical protein [Ignavibacteria bacterium]
MKELLVNMPNCTNLLFTFSISGDIIKHKRVSDAKAFSSECSLYYSLPEDLQDKIDFYLNPKAIKKEYYLWTTQTK